MRKKSILSLFAILSLTLSCGVPQAEHDELVEELKAVTEQLDECKNGEARIVAQVKAAYDEGNYDIARSKINLLKSTHPESPKNKEFELLLDDIEQKEITIRNEEIAAEKEKKRLENLNNTGMWRVGFYVDEFGEPTKEGYITNTQFILGLFSNTATQNSDLKVTFLISNKNDFSIQLYEYAGNNPVKAYSPDSYTVLVQDSEGNRMKLRAVNHSDRLTFKAAESLKIHNAFLKGGEVSFRITEVETPTTQYAFSVKNADYYENAYRLLEERK